MILYVITNLINGKRYVGQTVKSLDRRWQNHVSCANVGSTLYIHRAIRKYGAESFKIEEICQPNTQELMSALEKWYIGFYDTKNSLLGYNLTDGGDGMVGYLISDETRKRMSQAHIGQTRVVSKETRQKMSAAKLGIPLSEEHRKNLSESHKGIKPSKSSIKKRSEAMKGHEVSIETREKIRKVLMGHSVSTETREKIRLANSGKKHPKKTRMKMSKSHKRRIKNIIKVSA